MNVLKLYAFMKTIKKGKLINIKKNHPRIFLDSKNET